MIIGVEETPLHKYMGLERVIPLGGSHGNVVQVEDLHVCLCCGRAHWDEEYLDLFRCEERAVYDNSPYDGVTWVTDSRRPPDPKLVRLGEFWFETDARIMWVLVEQDFQEHEDPMQVWVNVWDRSEHPAVPAMEIMPGAMPGPGTVMLTAIDLGDAETGKDATEQSLHRGIRSLRTRMRGSNLIRITDYGTQSIKQKEGKWRTSISVAAVPLMRTGEV